MPNKVLMKYCPICKRYFPVKVYDKHMAKHNIPTSLATGDKNESGK
jgi:ribosomal protein L44E